MLGGAALVLALQISGIKPLGFWPAVWGLFFCLTLYISVSLFTRAPAKKADEIINYLRFMLPKGNFI